MQRTGCCFTGHRRILAEDLPALEIALENEIRRLAKRGITEFYAGGALGFDTLAAQVVLRLRATQPIHLHLLLPCKTQSRDWPEADRQVYQQILQQADSVRYVQEAFDEGCMLRRNDALVDSACVCICYLRHHRSGTGYTVRRARKQGLEVIHLFLTDPEQLTLAALCSRAEEDA